MNPAAFHIPYPVECLLGDASLTFVLAVFVIDALKVAG
jgi:hypothetical protein